MADKGKQAKQPQWFSWWYVLTGVCGVAGIAFGYLYFQSLVMGMAVLALVAFAGAGFGVLMTVKTLNKGVGVSKAPPTIVKANCLRIYGKLVHGQPAADRVEFEYVEDEQSLPDTRWFFEDLG